MIDTLLRPMWKTAAMEAASVIGESALYLVQFVFRFLRVVMLLAVWRTLLGTPGAAQSGAPAAAPSITLGALLSYTLIAEVFADQLSPNTEIEWSLHDGGIATRFLQPLSLVGQFSAQMAGRWVFGFCLFSLPLLLLSPLLGVNPLPASGAAAVLFLLSLLLTVVVGVAFDFIFAALLTYVEGSAYVISRVRQALAVLLSGSVIPLALMPWGLGELLQWSPFASLASAPLRIYTGTGEPLLLIALQVFWSVVLWALANWLWRRSRERLSSYGG
jgi:ABC-2 type transport system permease protein